MSTSYRTFDNRNVEAVVSQCGCVSTIEQSEIVTELGGAFQFIAFPTLTGTTPAYRLFRTKNVNISFKPIEIVCEVDNFELTFYENPVIASDGALTNDIIRLNRVINGRDPGLTIYTAPTVTSPGTLLDRYFLPGGEAMPGRFIGTIETVSTRFILKPNTDYLIKGQRLSGTNTFKVLVKYRWELRGLQ